MIWVVLFFVLGYFAVGVWFWRRRAWELAWKDARGWGHSDRLDTGNLSVGIILGGLQAFVWPAALFMIRGARTEGFYGFLREPEAAKERRELKESEEHVAQLEREVGIR